MFLTYLGLLSTLEHTRNFATPCSRALCYTIDCSNIRFDYSFLLQLHALSYRDFRQVSLDFHLSISLSPHLGQCDAQREDVFEYADLSRTFDLPNSLQFSWKLLKDKITI